MTIIRFNIHISPGRDVQRALKHLSRLLLGFKRADDKIFSIHNFLSHIGRADYNRINRKRESCEGDRRVSSSKKISCSRMPKAFSSKRTFSMKSPFSASCFGM